MALRTILPEFVCMHIFVTTGAFSERQTGKLPYFFSLINRQFVTGIAIGFSMLPKQLEAGAIVVEFPGRFKHIKIMTRGTIVRKAPLVGIRMACGAFLIQAQVGRRFFPDLPITDEFGLVTCFTCFAGVRSLQLIARKHMVKIVGVEAGHLKFLPVMFIVAFSALFTIDLPGCVVSAAFIYSFSYFSVASKTFVVGNLFTKYMALGTV